MGRRAVCQKAVATVRRAKAGIDALVASGGKAHEIYVCIYLTALLLLIPV